MERQRTGLDKICCCMSLRAGGIVVGCLGIISGIVGAIIIVIEQRVKSNYWMFGLIWTIPTCGMFMWYILCTDVNLCVCVFNVCTKSTTHYILWYSNFDVATINGRNGAP